MGVLINFGYTQAYLFVIGAFDPRRFPEPGIWIPYFSPLRGSWDLIWSQTYPAKFYPYVPDIFFLRTRFDLYLLNVLGVPVVLVILALVALWAYPCDAENETSKGLSATALG